VNRDELGAADIEPLEDLRCGALAEDVWHRDVAPERAEVGEDVPRPPQPILGRSLREVEQHEDNVLLIAAAAWLVMLGALAATAVVAAWLWRR
jgi:hypothetical protein